MWGFTKTMRETRPFGLPEDELRPGKVVADPIHGDIGLTRLEMQIVDSRPFQRLRRVKQLGSTHLVYPGATHTRFSHSLGAVRTVQMLLDAAVEQRDGLHPVPDLLAQWENEPAKYDRELARATVLARLGALLHDLCHLPFGHSIEDELGILEPHDENRWRLDLLWAEFDPELRQLLASDGLDIALKDVIAPKLGIKDPVIQDDYPFVLDLVGNTICADLVDYLARDHLFAGLPMALGHRFLSAFFITPDGENKFHRRRMALSVVRDGHERGDVVTELLKYLRYRFELTERVLVHHSKLKADAMVGKLMLLWRDELAEIPDGFIGPMEEPARRLERQLLRRGDEGLLEHLIETVTTDDSSSRARTIAKVAAALQGRRLFAEAGRAGPQDAPAGSLSDAYKRPADRLRLEHELAEYAEIEPWQIAVWVPSTDMRLKIAKVLVYDGSSVKPFDEFEVYGRKRGSELDDLHRGLWTVATYVHESVSSEAREEILVRLAQQTGIRWDGMRDEFDQDTEGWPDELAAARVSRDLDQGPDGAKELLAAAKTSETRQPKSPHTFAAVRAYYEQLAETHWACSAE